MKKKYNPLMYFSLAFLFIILTPGVLALCPDGTYYLSADPNTCLNCDLGYTNNSDHTGCIACPVGATEICNGLDDDCDRNVDEDNVCVPECLTDLSNMPCQVRDEFHLNPGTYYNVNITILGYYGRILGGGLTTFIGGTIYSIGQTMIYSVDLVNVDVYNEAGGAGGVYYYKAGATETPFNFNLMPGGEYFAFEFFDTDLGIGIQTLGGGAYSHGNIAEGETVSVVGDSEYTRTYLDPEVFTGFSSAYIRSSGSPTYATHNGVIATNYEVLPGYEYTTLINGDPSGEWILYHPTPTCIPTPEICDGVDNDCDGSVDEEEVCNPQCTPNWQCSEWGSCVGGNTNEGTQSCIEVSDLNNCGISYTGDYSEFTPQHCCKTWGVECYIYTACQNNIQICIKAHACSCYSCWTSEGYYEWINRTCGYDNDGDGVPNEIDCNDNNAAINPSATEICNGLDDDCDGVIDNLPADDGTTVQCDLTANVIVQYYMDESSGQNVADAENFLDGTATGTTIITGKVGNARNFTNRNEYIYFGNVDNKYSLTNNAPFTASFCVYQDTREPGYSLGYAQYDINDNPTVFAIYSPFWEGTLTNLGIYGGDALLEWYELENTEIILSQWNCYIFSFDGAYLSTYQNGILKDVLPYAYEGREGVLPLTVGKANIYPPDEIPARYIGAIDEILLLNRSISSIEAKSINDNLNAGKHSLGEEYTCTPSTEICDGVDNDCDGFIDNGLTFDLDNDGYSSIGSCEGTKNDCDDNDATINPGATELCNVFDDNCNGIANEGFLDTDSDDTADCIDVDDDNDGVPDVNDGCPLIDATGFDANNDGCIDSVAGLQQVINTLPDDVLSDKIKNSLTSKVSNALKSFDKENDKAAINMLGAFINQVEAQRGKKISEEAANMLITYANNVITKIKAG